MNESNRTIITRFGIVYLFLVMLIIFIIYNIVKIQYKEGDIWREMLKKNIKSNIEVAAKRGDIYSSDGRLMASTIPTYTLYMDMRAEALHIDTAKLFRNNVDTLAEALSLFFKDKTKAQYKSELIHNHKIQNHSYQFHKKKITYSQLKQVREMPLFKYGQIKSGLIAKESFVRLKPFGSLATRTIGDIYADNEEPKNGLELGLDSLLKGKPGKSSKRKVANRFEDIIEIEPIDGMDVITTIDINFQDIAERALIEKMTEISAKVGYAAVMEVKTGEIKAIVNMERNSNGSYSENRNGVVSDMTEPGSTFKVASLMAVLDDGKAKLSDSIATGNGKFNFGRAVMKDHNHHRGGYQTISLENALNASSNIGISRTIVRAYGDNPSKFVEKLYKMGLVEPFQLYIPGTATPNIRHPKDKNTNWYNTTLPWMSIGYEVQIPPIYTLAFFNAIANEGRFIEPTLVKSINKNGQVVKEIKPRIINEQICKPSVLKDVQKALLGVVEHPKYGTAKPAHSSLVRIAGKTGTAQISQGKSGYSKHQVSFCGYFPYEDPKYTCIVVIREPSGLPSGGLMAGTVVKRIAEQITAIDTKNTIQHIGMDSTLNKSNTPNIKTGNLMATKNIMSKLSLDFRYDGDSNWGRMTKDDASNMMVENIQISNDKVPNLNGMGMKDAIYLCESVGLKVNVIGVGKLRSQSLPANSKITTGQSITLKFEP